MEISKDNRLDYSLRGFHKRKVMTFLKFFLDFQVHKNLKELREAINYREMRVALWPIIIYFVTPIFFKKISLQSTKP